VAYPAPSVPARDLPLDWLGPLREPSGYADEARAFLLALDRAGYRISARAVESYPDDAGAPQHQRDAMERALRRAGPDGEVVALNHLPGGGPPRQGAGPCVARTMFETDGLPLAWKRSLIAFDEVWVPTEFNAATFAAGGLPSSRLHVLPETLDFELFAPGAEPLDLWGERPRGRPGFVFLSSFDFTDRKGWDVLLDAWAEAFGPDDDVCLVLKCLTLHVAEPEMQARVEGRLEGRACAPVLLYPTLLAAADLPRLYAAADAYVMASRGEGWGRPYMEAMAMGLPTIGTRFSGNLAFMHDGNSWLVGGDLVPVPAAAQSHTTLYAGHRWLEPDRAELADALREVASDPVSARARAVGARLELLERFGPDVVAERIAELVEGALERWRARRGRPLASVWRGDFGSGHSLAVVNEAVTEGLEALGGRVERLVAGSPPSPADAVGVAQQWPPSFEPPSGGPFVLYQPWEFGAAPRAWVEAIRETVDEVWTPSAASRAAFVEAGVAPELVHVVPNGVDLSRFRPEGPARLLPRSAGTVFLFVGGTIHRKGVDLLLDAYGQAFEPGDDVLLVVKSFGGAGVYRGMVAEDAVSSFAARGDTPAVVLLRDDVPYDEMPALYRAADVLVQPYRAEGFCLPALEALACGLPVIVTAGGPTDEFVGEECGWRIPSRHASIPPGSLPPELDVGEHGFLLEPDVGALAACLREAADPGTRAAMAAAARPQAERCSWERAAEAVRERLAALAGKEPVRRVALAEVPDRRGTLFAVLADWEEPSSWAPAVVAYAHAFGPGADTTLALAAREPESAAEHVETELAAAGIDAAALADVVLLDGLASLESLELAADAVVCTNGCRPPRARRIVPADPDALRAVAAGPYPAHAWKEAS
jgi:glycosyltransferase involved in cell wall biosynthesis